MTAKNAKDAWALRKALHSNFLEVIVSEGGFGATEHSKTVEAVSSLIEQCGTIGHTKLGERCAPFKKMRPYEQDSVKTELINRGHIEIVKTNRGIAYKWRK